MKRSRFGKEQIIGILRPAEAGIKAADLCRQNGISDATFYKRRSKYGGLEIWDAKRLRQFEEENCSYCKHENQYCGIYSALTGTSFSYFGKSLIARSSGAAWLKSVPKTSVAAQTPSLAPIQAFPSALP